MNTEVNKKTQCGWNNWRKMSGVFCDEGTTKRKGKDPQDDRSTSYAVVYGMETVPTTSSHVKKQEVT